MSACHRANIPAFGAGLAVSAAASSSKSPPIFYACSKSGSLSSVSNVTHGCAKGYKAVSWNSVGPQGIKGIQGPKGAPGSPVSCILVTLCTWGANLSGGSYGFSGPQAVAFDGTHLWVTNDIGNSVTELNAADGSWVQTLSGGTYRLNLPQSIAFDGTHVWVTNMAGNSVTEIFNN